jgi:phage terminase small subunit
MPKTLTLMERRFVDAYLGSARGNAAQAARQAGYAGSPAVLKVQGSRLLTRANLRNAIDASLHREGREEVMAADERDRLLSMFARMKSLPVRDRIRAIAELNKCTGRHSIQHLQSGRITLEQAMERSRSI